MVFWIKLAWILFRPTLLQFSVCSALAGVSGAHITQFEISSTSETHPFLANGKMVKFIPRHMCLCLLLKYKCPRRIINRLYLYTVDTSFVLIHYLYHTDFVSYCSVFVRYFHEINVPVSVLHCSLPEEQKACSCDKRHFAHLILLKITLIIIIITRPYRNVSRCCMKVFKKFSRINTVRRCKICKFALGCSFHTRLVNLDTKSCERKDGSRPVPNAATITIKCCRNWKFRHRWDSFDNWSYKSSSISVTPSLFYGSDPIVDLKTYRDPSLNLVGSLLKRSAPTRTLEKRQTNPRLKTTVLSLPEILTWASASDLS